MIQSQTWAYQPRTDECVSHLHNHTVLATPFVKGCPGCITGAQYLKFSLHDYLSSINASETPFHWMVGLTCHNLFQVSFEVITSLAS